MFILKTIVTKPAGVAWRKPELIAGTTLTLGAWILSQPGVLSSRTRRAANRMVNTTLFQDQAAYDAFVAARATNPEYLARQAYSAANGITTVTRKFQLVA